MPIPHTKTIINPSITPDSLDELKTTILKILEDNQQNIQTKIINKRLPVDQADENFKNFVFKEYQIKQQQIDHISSFVLKFIASLQEIAEQINYRDNKILQLRKSLQNATDFIIKIQDENDKYRQKIIQAETYIDWIQQQKQFIDLLSLSGQRTLQKCKSQKRFFSNSIIQEQSYLQKSKRKQRVDYSKLKQFIKDLKQQKSNLAKQYNILLEKYNLKKNECQKINILLNQLSQKNYTQDKQFSTQQYVNNKQNSTTQSFTNNSTIKKQIKQFQWTLNRSSGAYSQQQSNKKAIKNFKQMNSKRYKYDTFPFDCQEKSFQKEQKIYKNMHSHFDVGINTKKMILSDKYTQSQQIFFSNKIFKKDEKCQQNLQISKNIIKQITSTKPNSEFGCQISISIKGNNPNMLVNRDLSKLIDLNALLQCKEKGFTKCNKIDKNKLNIDKSAANSYDKNLESSKIDSQKYYEGDDLCNHLYCYFTNKIVHDRIKKYKYFKGKGKK